MGNGNNKYKCVCVCACVCVFIIASKQLNIQEHSHRKSCKSLVKTATPCWDSKSCVLLWMGRLPRFVDGFSVMSVKFRGKPAGRFGINVEMQRSEAAKVGLRKEKVRRQHWRCLDAAVINKRGIITTTFTQPSGIESRAQKQARVCVTAEAIAVRGPGRPRHHP